MIHYDALSEMSGQLSFSVALLNAAGDGVILSGPPGPPGPARACSQRSEPAILR